MSKVCRTQPFTNTSNHYCLRNFHTSPTRYNYTTNNIRMRLFQRLRPTYPSRRKRHPKKQLSNPLQSTKRTPYPSSSKRPRTNKLIPSHCQYTSHLQTSRCRRTKQCPITLKPRNSNITNRLSNSKSATQNNTLHNASPIQRLTNTKPRDGRDYPKDHAKKGQFSKMST